MNEHIAFLYQEIENLKQKKSNGKMTSEDVVYLRLVEQALKFIQENLLRQVSTEVANNNMSVITEYQKYLDSEVQKYTNRMGILIEAKEQQSHTKKIDERIKKCKDKLDNACQERATFQKSYQGLTVKITPRSVGRILPTVFRAPIAGSDMLYSTRFGSGVNDFLIKDSQTGEVKLNTANVLLFLEVFGDHKSENLKKLVQIKELEQNANEDSKDAQIESIRATIPETLRQADVHVFDRFCHYSSLPWFSTLSSENITDKICYGNEEIVQPAIKHLKIALILDAANNFSRQDLIAMIGEKEVMSQENSVQEQISEFTSRSL